MQPKYSKRVFPKAMVTRTFSYTKNLASPAAKRLKTIRIERQ